MGGALASSICFCRKSRRLSCIFSTAYYLYGMCITGKSFVSAVKRGSDRAYRYAREDGLEER